MVVLDIGLTTKSFDKHILVGKFIVINFNVFFMNSPNKSITLMRKEINVFASGFIYFVKLFFL
ncbi:hypothetical protein BK60_14420 [Neisseria gonorrhoeae]|nr:hypothetical protein BK60_14420 [Neisseria gonorrhoeae]